MNVRVVVSSVRLARAWALAFLAALLALGFTTSGCQDNGAPRKGSPPDASTSTIAVDRPTNVQANGTDVATITVSARDASGNPVANVLVTIAATGTSNTLTQPTHATDASGTVTGTLASTSVGTQTLSATLTPSSGVAVAIAQTVTVQFVTPSASGSGSNLSNLTGGNTGSNTSGNTGGTTAPTIVSVNPASGAVGTAVAITGTGFTGATRVAFGTTVQASFVVVSATQIATTVPSGASSGPVSVTTPAGTATAATSFTVSAPGGGGGSATPQLATMTPNAGSPGTRVVFTGTNLTGTTHLAFGVATQATFAVNAQGTQLTTSVPAGASTAAVTVTTGGGAAVTSTAFTLDPGTFALPKTFGVALVFSAVAVADVNGDGKLDLAAASPSDDTIRLFFGKGDGTFPATASIALASGARPLDVKLVDVDASGSRDIVTADNGTSTVTVLVNDGAGNFTQAAGSPYALAGGDLSPVALATGDVDRNGSQDVVVLSATGSIRVLANRGGSPLFAPGAQVTLAAAPTSPAGFAIGDLRTTGKLDLLAETRSGGALVAGNGDGTFGTPGAVTLGTGSAGLALGDLDRDGKLDVAEAVDATTGAVAVARNAGSGTFSVASTPATGTSSPVAVAIADVDRDGILDLVIASQGSSVVTILVGNGDGTFKTPRTTPAIPGASAIALEDVNGDGKLDVVVVGSSGGAVLLGN